MTMTKLWGLIPKLVVSKITSHGIRSSHLTLLWLLSFLHVMFNCLGNMTQRRQRLKKAKPQFKSVCQLPRNSSWNPPSMIDPWHTFYSHRTIPIQWLSQTSYYEKKTAAHGPEGLVVYFWLILSCSRITWETLVHEDINFCWLKRPFW